MEPDESNTAINQTSEKTEHSMVEASNDARPSDVIDMHKVEEGTHQKEPFIACKNNFSIIMKQDSSI